MTIWRHIIAWLVWLSADPVTVDLEHARAAAAVSVARASMVADAAPAPGPTPPAPKPACVCGETCVGGYWRPDDRIYQRCECPCDRCRKARTQLPPWGTAVPVEVPCPSGTCPVPAALPMVVTPAKP